MKFDDKEWSVYNGRKLRVEIFGASHSEQIGVKVNGLEGQTFNSDKLDEFMARRRAKKSAYSTKRLEGDKVIFESGVKDGVISKEFKAVIKNSQQRSSDYEKLNKIPRPSHADFVAWSKYKDGFDARGGGKFSGRLTAPMCIAGGICKQILEKKGVKINAFISSIGEIKGKTYQDIDAENFDFDRIASEFPTVCEKDKEQMLALIEKVAGSGDSVGGKIDCVVTGVPVGAGEYMFDSIESVISHLAFAVPAVKGIEFGKGFSISETFGSLANDAFYYDGDRVKTKTNNNGGINGGIANGMPITFRVAVKPTPSIMLEQDTVDLTSKSNVKIKIGGRHDACIVPRAVPVIEAITAIAIYDILGD